MAEVTVRPARPEDCPALRGLIQELADYEKMSDGPKIGADVLMRDGFGDTRRFRCSVAELADGTLVGFVLYVSLVAWKGRAVHMEDLYVCPAYRGRGLGTRLWGAVLQSGLSEGAVQCRLNVLGWNAPSLDFYAVKGARDTTASTGYHMFRLHGAAMDAFAARQTKLPGGVVVRAARGEELAAVNAMQAQLAASMGIPGEMLLTAADLKAAAEATPPLCHFLLATDGDGAILGFSMFYFMYSTWEGPSIYMEDIFVKQQHRGNGVGQALWQGVVQRGLAEGCRRCDFVTVESNAAAIAYYESRGAVDLTKAEDWHCLALPQPAMRRMVQALQLSQ